VRSAAERTPNTLVKRRIVAITAIKNGRALESLRRLGKRLLLLLMVGDGCCKSGCAAVVTRRRRRTIVILICRCSRLWMPRRSDERRANEPATRRSVCTGCGDALPRWRGARCRGRNRTIITTFGR